jgi:hypothetical protein
VYVVKNIGLKKEKKKKREFVRATPMENTILKN